MSYVIDPGPGGWLLVPLAFGLLIAYELGFRFGRHVAASAVAAKKAQTDVVLAGLLGMLGLLLAFSFGIVNDKYAKRRALVLDDANAIATTAQVTIRRNQESPPLKGALTGPSEKVPVAGNGESATKGPE